MDEKLAQRIYDYMVSKGLGFIFLNGLDGEMITREDCEKIIDKWTFENIPTI